MKPTIITYLRYSSKQQADGLSEYRQSEINRKFVEKFCAEHEVDLNEVISLKDLGVSAYRGLNLTLGSFSQTIKKFKSGEIGKKFNEDGEINTYLIVESLDRITRTGPFKSTQIFTELLEYTNIVVLADGEKKIYSKKSIDSTHGMMDLFMALVSLQRSHSESSMKEFRSRKSWEKKREDLLGYFTLPEEERKGLERPKNATAMCPFWLRAKKDGRGYEFIPENKKVMDFLIEKLLDGNGMTRSVRLLNDEIDKGTLKPKLKKANRKTRHFRAAAYSGLFNSEVSTVKGDYLLTESYYPTDDDVEQGKYPEKHLGKRVRKEIAVLKNYYPALMTESQAAYIRSLMGERRSKGTKPNKAIKNLAQGILRCPHCNSTYIKAKDRKNVYLRCNLAREGLCKAKVIKHEVFEHNLLHFCKGLNINKIISNQTGDMALESSLKEFEHQMIPLQVQKSELEGDMAQLVKNISSIKIPSLLEKVQEDYLSKENELKRVIQEIDLVETSLMKLQQQMSMLDDDSSLQELIDLTLDENADDEVRQRFNIELNKVVKGMTVLYKATDDNPFDYHLISIQFLDGVHRLIPVHEKLTDKIHNILPYQDAVKVDSVDFSETVILPTDYLEGLESGKYPQLDGMAKYYQENPAKYLKLKHQIDQSQEIYQ
ncbi:MULTISPECIES: recombinase family protein [Vibrio]|uniref:recombinase family protein n=2 Tax=Vibrionaceae TaxID=641 RepID=UPI0004125408|nr:MULTISPECIES: recombinase family protein [Vibrio]EIU6866821.1 recombinase family protein [Vibrio parahaemolyticus]ELX4189951.1 recombinase family protein [Vibrio vulnificus]MCG6432054.1 recombinase family protein [Vibrio parahaemolyticus]MCS0308242.1 recombinase family protein [Vibrio diabolicus]MDF5464911.1 recombinase family protein [Vibrio parahaemolyticus]